MVLLASVLLISSIVATTSLSELPRETPSFKVLAIISTFEIDCNFFWSVH
jgi:hypothetical protein